MALEQDSVKGSFSQLDRVVFPPFEAGWVWLVGAGPGAAGLITLLGYHALQNADIVIHDSLVSTALLEMIPSGTLIEHVGKRCGKPSPSQRDISERLIMQASSGKRVLRLKGGDPFIFGRGVEECQALTQAAIPFRIVPGVSAGIGGLAYAGIPITHRAINHSVVFLTGHDTAADTQDQMNWKAIAMASPVIVMYMALRNLRSIASRLLEAGRSPDEPVGIVSSASLPWQSVLEIRLGSIVDGLDTEQSPLPAIIVVGPVLDLRQILDWYGSELRGNTVG